MALKVHMKIHEKEEERKAQQLKLEIEEAKRRDTPIPRASLNGKTPRRAAAMK